MLIIYLLFTSWTMEIVTPTTILVRPTLAIDSSGNPHILAVYDTSLLALYSKIGALWICDTIDTCASEIYSHTPLDLTIDYNNCPWTIYRVYNTLASKYYLIVARKDGFGWVKDTVDSGLNIDFLWKAIAIDKGNNPHITYTKRVDELPNDKAGLYGYKILNQWLFDTVPSSKYTFEYCCSIDCDSSNQPHISWIRQELFPPEGLFHSYKIGGNMFSEQVDDMFFLVSSPTSIRAGSDNILHVVSEDGRDWLKYYYYNGVSWNIEHVDSPAVIGTPKAMDIDGLGRPWILYSNFVAYRKEPNVWQRVTLPSINPPFDCQSPGALRIDHDGTIHVSRIAYNAPNTIREIHYIYGTIVGIEEDKRLEAECERLKLMVLPNVIRNNVQIQYNIPEKQRITLKLYDIVGREVLVIANRIVDAGIFSLNINTTKLSSGVYFLILDGKMERETKRLLIVR